MESEEDIMSDLMRMTGLVSGMDTSTIVGALVSAANYKTTKLKNQQTKLGWKQDAWKTLNSKVYSFYTGALSEMRMENTFNTKTATVADASIASVSVDSGSVIGTQTLSVKSLATSGYLTGGVVSTGGDKATTGTKLSELGVSGTVSVGVAIGDDADSVPATPTKTVQIDDTMTIAQALNEFKKAGINASFDETNQRFFLSSSDSGADKNFEIIGDSSNKAALQAMGLYYTYSVEADGMHTYDTYTSEAGSAAPVKVQGTDAEIELNGAKYTSNSNSFVVNGMTIQAKSTSAAGSVTTITTSRDIDAIYDKIVDFFDEYNSLINEMDKLYNADAAKGYDVLSDDEKSEMSDEQVEKWESKIKDSLLRKDDSLSTLINLFKNTMSGTSTGGDSWSTFGIATLGYFNAADNEKGAYHIDGNSDDDDTKDNEDVLKKMLASDPDRVTKFMTEITGKLYNGLGTNGLMKSIESTRSVYKVYNDKLLQKEYDNLSSEITKQEKYVSDLEDFYYSKFTAMETALAKLQNSSSAIAGLLNM
jgi:flagellar hook-associated protein 2